MLLIYIKDLVKNYGKVNLIPNTDEIYINYSINSGNRFKFDEDGKAVRENFYEAVFCRYIHIHGMVYRKTR